MSVLSNDELASLRQHIRLGGVVEQGPESDGVGHFGEHEDCMREMWDLLDTIDSLRYGEDTE